MRGLQKHPFCSNYFKVLDEYILPPTAEFQGTKIGGLSDLDYDGEYFYAICDLPSSPRIYQFKLKINHQKIDTIIFKKVIPIQRQKGLAKQLVWDSEGLIYNEQLQRFLISSEGNIKKKKDPFIAQVDTSGILQSLYKIPSYFKANAAKGPRNNGVFEGLSSTVDHKGFWMATELPLTRDGHRPKVFKTWSPLRFTYYQNNSNEPKKQFAYPLGRIRKLPFLPFGINGVSAILEYQPLQFLVLERAFSARHRSNGFRAIIYWASAKEATPTLHRYRLGKKDSIKLAKKIRLFDFNKVRRKLTQKRIDNLEGISLGPRLKNGHQTLVLIADNNFSSWTPELNQVILLEIIPKP